MIDTNYYCDRCGKHIVNKKDCINDDLYADGLIYIGDTVGEIEYNILVNPKKSQYYRRLSGTGTFCTDCSLEIAIFLGLLKEDEYDKEVVEG